MPTPIAIAARKVLAGLKAKFSGRRPTVGTEAPEQQHVELDGRQRDGLGSPPTVSQSGHVTNQISGTAHKVFQAGDIQGDVRF